LEAFWVDSENAVSLPSETLVTDGRASDTEIACMAWTALPQFGKR